MKTVLREGARLLFLTRCDVLLHPHGNQSVFAYNVPAGYYRVIMPKVTSHTRGRITCLHKEVFYPVQILKALRSENLQGSLASVTRIINKIQKTGSTENRPRSGRPTKLPADMKAFIEKQMRINDEATSIQIQKQLAKRGIFMNSSTVRRSRAKQG